ncbi:DUF6875 domain-containing protein [Saccharothrix obliqua]|uniref:DUF6875 domain-containing protein n=1 Tax=Saccharothrix obliqua TaxID=2861747 RepID=UPI001C5EEFD7|nr:hypothetical protein [Saccharothrix obliqua]MBW4718782.1 hypothetical protein [Saccharothrix obliqua]
MLTHPDDPRRVLVERGDLDPLALPAELRGYEIHLRATFDWGRGYLTNPHPDLGRAGSVCPFASASLTRERFFLAVQPGVPADVREPAETLRFYRDWFLELAPRDQPSAQITTILVLFPDIPADAVESLVDGVQALLKPEYVRMGLMIGEFHNGPPAKSGLWNRDFRPLRSPVPMLAMRHMVPTDYPFLREDPEQARVYLELFGDQVPAQLRDQVERERAVGTP